MLAARSRARQGGIDEHHRGIWAGLEAMNIGKFRRVMVIEPVIAPVPEPLPTLVPAPVPEGIPEPVTASGQTVPAAVR